MIRQVRVLLVIVLVSIGCFSQSKQETMGFIFQEMMTFESDAFLIKEVSFSKDGSVFTFRTYVPVCPEEELVIPLRDVNLFSVKRRTPGGGYSYDLMVETRGRLARFKVNGQEVFGVRAVLKGVQNRTRVEALAKAFQHLNRLSCEGGKKPLFCRTLPSR